MATRIKFLTSTFKKVADTTKFKVQLIDKEEVYSIPENAVITIYIANGRNLLVQKEVIILDREEGLVEFTIKERLSGGTYNIEFVVTYDDEIITFPTETYQSFKIASNLRDLPFNEVKEDEEDRVVEE